MSRHWGDIYIKGSQKVSFSLFITVKQTTAASYYFVIYWHVLPPLHGRCLHQCSIHGQWQLYWKREKGKKWMVFSISWMHQTQNPQIATQCGCVQCKCDTHSISVEIVPWHCKWLDECHEQGKKWSSFIVKHIFQSHRWNGVGRQTGIAGTVTAGINLSHSNAWGILHEHLSYHEQ